MLKFLYKVAYNPPEFLIKHVKTKTRRMIGFWTVVIAALLVPVFGSQILFVSILSVVALVPNFASETPVEEEE